MFCEEMANNAASKALRKLGIRVEREIAAGDAVIAENTFDFTSQKANGWYMTRKGQTTIQEGVTYLLILDGKQYIRECKRVNESFLAIGNAAYGMETNTELNGEDTGEPFCIASEVGANRVSVTMKTGGSHTYSLWTTVVTEKVVDPISDKYLPGVCLPAVELTTVPTGDGAALTDAENAVLTKAYAGDLPIVCKLNAGSVTLRAVFAKSAGSGMDAFSARTAIGSIVLRNDEGTWTALAFKE